MAQTSVSSSVLSIIASFSSGLNVIKRLKERRKSRKTSKTNSDELNLSRSLRKGPEAIGWEYQTYSQQLGEGYAVGDAPAQSSLAEILLKLNTGLVGIITTFLHRERHGQLELDYRSLTDLSEQSREQTVGVLRQLYQRLRSRQLPANLPTNSRGTKRRPPQNGVDGKARKAHRSPRKQSKIRGPTLARVTIQDSSKPSQIALVRPSEPKRTSRSSSRLHLATVPNTPLSQASTAVASSQVSLPPDLPPGIMPVKTSRPVHVRAKTSPEVVQKPPRQQSRPRNSNHHPDQTTSCMPSAPNATAIATPPVPKEPFPASPSAVPPQAQDFRRRKETPTFYSTATASTKLGEIPMHKWAVPYDFDAMSIKNREAMASGWPRLEEEEVARRNRRGLLARLFRRRSDTVS